MTMVTVFKDYAVQGKHPAAPSAFDLTLKSSMVCQLICARIYAAC